VSRLTDNLVYAAYLAGWTVVRKLPERFARKGFEKASDYVWWRRGKSVQRLERNLARVRPKATKEELRQLSRQGMRSYLRYWCETFRLPDLSADQIVQRVVTHGEDGFRKALASGKGVIAALPHLGNWDLAGGWACSTGATFTTVAERLRPERLFDRFASYREALGMEILPHDGGADVLSVLGDRLREGGFVVLVSDRDLSERGIEVSFFGEKTRMPAGPAALAVRTGAILMPATLWYDGPHLHIRFHDPIERPAGRQPIAAMTQALADTFAETIAAHPEDWHMLQRLWLADLDRTRVPVG
jgi:phosphatidylinositol dimannoside acyltransferase